MGSLEKKIATAILTAIRARRNESTASQGDLTPQSHAAIAPARLREAHFSDFPAVAELKQRWGLHADSLENWERLWQRNPALLYAPFECPIGWVLEADGAVVGYLGNISLLYRFGDRTLTAVTAHGLVVDPAYRAVSLTLVAAFFRQKSVDLFISTTAIAAVGKIALAFKSSPLPQADYDTAFFWVLRPYPFARALMRKLKLGPAFSQAGSMLTALAVATDKNLRRRWPKASSTAFAVNVIRVDEIGDDFQTLWTEKQREGGCLLADRSPAALRWHFGIPGDRGCARVLCCHQGRELVGYTVVRTDTNQENGLRTSIIADLVVRRDDPEVVKALWKAAYDYAHHTGSHILEVLGFPPSVRHVASQWNPYLRRYPACPFYYKAADPEVHKTLSDGALWYASPFDGDATLIRPSYSNPASPDLRNLRRQTRTPTQTEDTRHSITSDLLEAEHTEVV
jgi:hypothetical protein